MISICGSEGKQSFHTLASAITLFAEGGMMEARLEARVHGLVQGVFFRHFTQLKARELALSGTVANQPDGTVRVVAEGHQANLNQLLAWLQHGPELARVTDVEVSWEPPLGDSSSFMILR